MVVSDHDRRSQDTAGAAASGQRADHDHEDEEGEDDWDQVPPRAGVHKGPG
jgi:hypothetical protein